MTLNRTKGRDTCTKYHDDKPNPCAAHSELHKGEHDPAQLQYEDRKYRSDRCIVLQGGHNWC